MDKLSVQTSTNLRVNHINELCSRNKCLKSCKVLQESESTVFWTCFTYHQLFLVAKLTFKIQCGCLFLVHTVNVNNFLCL